MRWWSHAGTAGALAAVVDPGAVPLAMLGATAPDWLEWVGSAVAGRKIRHRTVTHVLTSWAVAALFFAAVWDFRGYGLAFAAGGICHWLQDSLTVTGVPVSWWSDRRTTLAGGRLRTGGVAEYVITAAVVVVCAAVVWARGPEGGYLPFFRDWPGLYRSGLVDGAEWRSHRFEFF
ncbi:metal-dependent hydrolase [Aromatoleum bremense]|uniref:Metal-dependent hydrolase n=1 Tax=Aromatoleum bremense TaxID=76115 RepID=A0ABX1P040_9RHOO|nr:metal-dependent hydrolase [Aromatoleum bremense]